MCACARFSPSMSRSRSRSHQGRPVGRAMSSHNKSFKSDTVVGSLRDIYEKRLRPLESTYLFSKFHSPPLAAGDFSAKPMILLVGQYSTGKTTFIKYLLNSSFPGMNIGPEPTTDRFCVIMDGDEGVIPGNALVSDVQKPFCPLSKFGNAFLNRFQCSTMRNPVLDSVTFIDTPGILSGEKQRVDRGYDYSAVLHWFAEVVDRIILLFDAHKLDISDEFRRVIESIRGYDEKIRIVMNKADMIDAQQLMRVYGALMWGLGKVLGTPEVVRVHIGSFWDKPLQFDMNRELFELEARDLFRDLQTLPANSAMRKLNDFIRRVRLAKVHAYIIGQLKKEMPALIGKSTKKQQLILNLDQVYATISRQYQIPLGDFPDINHMKKYLADHDFSSFQSLRPKLLERVDIVLSEEIPHLMQMIPSEKTECIQNGRGFVHGGVFEGDSTNSPFTSDAHTGLNEGRQHPSWIVNDKRQKWDQLFKSLSPNNNLLSGGAAKTYMLESKLPQPALRLIWQLADVDKDGFLDADEFALASYLMEKKLSGVDLPNTLPPHLIPPSKRLMTNGTATPVSSVDTLTV